MPLAVSTLRLTDIIIRWCYEAAREQFRQHDIDASIIEAWYERPSTHWGVIGHCRTPNLLMLFVQRRLIDTIPCVDGRPLLARRLGLPFDLPRPPRPSPEQLASWFARACA